MSGWRELQADSVEDYGERLKTADFVEGPEGICRSGKPTVLSII